MICFYFVTVWRDVLLSCGIPFANPSNTSGVCQLLETTCCNSITPSFPVSPTFCSSLLTISRFSCLRHNTAHMLQRHAKPAVPAIASSIARALQRIRFVQQNGPYWLGSRWIMRFVGHPLPSSPPLAFWLIRPSRASRGYSSCRYHLGPPRQASEPASPSADVVSQQQPSNPPLRQ